MDEKKKKLIQQVRILSISLAAGIILLSLQTLWSGAKIFEWAALGLTVFGLIIITFILKRIVRMEE